MRCLLAAGLAYGDICSYRVNMGALAKPWASHLFHTSCLLHWNILCLYEVLAD
uniref:Uncharacterized protein n=1 Tax=Aegilops tauschii subsp. strangulata TaxID=200361 RepID=A0A453HYK5_AEGTS